MPSRISSIVRTRLDGLILFFSIDVKSNLVPGMSYVCLNEYLSYYCEKGVRIIIQKLFASIFYRNVKSKFQPCSSSKGKAICRFDCMVLFVLFDPSFKVS